MESVGILRGRRTGHVRQGMLCQNGREIREILRNVVRALLCTKVGTQGLRLGITDALGEMKARVWEVTPRVVFLRLSDEDS